MENDKPPTRGQRLAATRAKLGWSQRDLARFLEVVSQALISLAENDSDLVSGIAWKVLTMFCDQVDQKIVRKEDLPPLPTTEPEGKSE